MNQKHIKTLYIVAGAAGEIGTSFCKALSDKQADVLAVIRNTLILINSKFIIPVKCDLSDSRSISESFGKIDFFQYDRVVFLHTIGTDKYDPRGYPLIQKMKTIDPDIYDTNVNTFKYPLRYLISRLESIYAESGKLISFKAVLLGGIPDKFTPFVIEGFCEAKNLCREYIRSAVSLHPGWISGLAINVSSTITKSALKVRPLADLAYWLKPDEVVMRSIDALMSDKLGFNEIEIFKNSPEFKEGYYEDSEALYEKWSRETGTIK